MTVSVEDLESRQVAYMEVSSIVPHGSSTADSNDRSDKPLVWTLSFLSAFVCSFITLSLIDWLTDLLNYCLIDWIYLFIYLFTSSSAMLAQILAL